MQLWRFLHPSALGFTLQDHRTSPDRQTQGRALLGRCRPHVTWRSMRDRAIPRTYCARWTNSPSRERWLMSVGPKKGPLIRELAQRLPANARILELGAYCGYSSIMIASAFGPEARITSIEIDRDAVASSRANVEVAGLSDRITFVHGPSTKMIATLEGRFDLVFLDHWKDLYKTDLQLIEQRKLIGPGSIVVADNVGKIFAPEAYLNYVRNCGHYDCEHREATIEYTSVPDAVEISVYRPH